MATSAPLIDSVPKKVVQILIYKYFNLLNHVVDPNSLNLDPDPEFLFNLDLDPGLCNQFWRKKMIKTIFEKNKFLKKIILLKVHQKKILASWVSNLWI